MLSKIPEMHLKRIVVSDFKNISSADLHFSPKINCIFGRNGEGKTNLADAIHYLSMTKDMLAVQDRYAVRYGTDSAAVYGEYALGADVARVGLKICADGQKTLKYNDKPCARFSEHIGRLPIVPVSPADMSLVSDAAEERRRFLNGMLSQIDRNYLNSVMSYNKLIKQRNALLRQGGVQDILLETFTDRLGVYAGYIHEKRAWAADLLTPLVSEYYSALSGGREEIGLAYVSELSGKSMQELLSASLARDKVLGYTSTGVHRDDLLFTMDGHPVRKCASQGQRKSFLVSLKLAQSVLMHKVYGHSPLLLLDDLFDKLDRERVGALVDMVAGEGFGQIFITDTDYSALQGVTRAFSTHCMFIEASGGNFREAVL